MVTKEELLMTKHAQEEANDEGISRIEIAEAIGCGPRIREGNHYITIYQDITVVYEKIQKQKFKIITAHLGRPGRWKEK